MGKRERKPGELPGPTDLRSPNDSINGIEASEFVLLGCFSNKTLKIINYIFEELTIKRIL